jgi:2-polyprenyl-3-methyl-5-hydroxy-6-metoxy-1,4-benzoquinol methylase
MMPTSIENEVSGIVERIDPSTVPPGILSIHEARYRFAVPYCKGQMVADIACGAGYGSRILADAAARVIGLDASSDAVGFASERYRAPNLQFEVGDALNMRFSAESFDVIVSFETIEHLSDIDRFVKEVVRTLREGGTFIVSTPIVPKTNPRPENPHHTIEFSVDDFRALLLKSFDGLEMFGQSRVQTQSHRLLQSLDVFGIRHRIPGLLRRRASRALGTVPFEDMSVSNQRIVKDDFSRAHDMVAVCSRPRRA